MFKDSPNRERAIAGARNQAWDLTHLIEFVRRANENDGGKKRFLFATFDEHLRLMARLVIQFPKGAAGEEAHLTALSKWWPIADAKRIIDAIFEYVECMESSEWRAKRAPFPDFIDRMIALGEQRVRDLVPR